MKDFIGFLLFFATVGFTISIIAGLQSHNNFLYYPIRLWEFLFDSWEITIKNQGEEDWQETKTYDGIRIGDPDNYKREYVIYIYKHKFFNKEKLVKKYLD